MKKDTVLDMIGESPDTYVKESGTKKKKKLPRWSKWAGGIAAVLALVLLIRTPTIPLAISAKAVSEVGEARITDRDDAESIDLWLAENAARRDQTEIARAPIANFAQRCTAALLSGSTKNQVWCPVNAYIALAMTAELTGSDTQKEVLDVLGAENTSLLRQWVSAVWESLYENDGREICVLANSLWLDDTLTYYQDVMDILSYDYYASVYQGTLGTSRTNQDIANWLNNQTGGLLKNRTGKISLVPNAVLALVSTVYFQSQWDEQFEKKNNTESTFHAADGDVTCTFMNAELLEMYYYWADNYGAVKMWLSNGSSMWFILPDEGYTVDDILNSKDYMDMISLSEDFPQENRKWMKVNLSVPQFDVSSETDLKEALKSMGLTKIFDIYGNDFTPSIECEDPVYLDTIHQDTRVSIDEEGVTAASYILLEFGAGAAEPPNEIMDFVLDRPFVFAVTNSSIPLFVGTVQNPIS